MTRDDILMWYRNAKTADKLKAKLAEDDPVEYSDAEEQYSEIVAGIKQVYENSPADYEQDLYYKYYWLPDNARMIKHILIKFDSDDSAEITARTTTKPVRKRHVKRRLRTSVRVLRK